MRASPDSLSRTRLNAGATRSPRLLADGEAGEAADADVLAGLRGDLVLQLLDRLALVLVLVDVLLVEEDDLLHPLAQLALDDPRADVLGLVGGLLLEDLRLAVAGGRVDVVLGDELRVGGGDVQCDVPREGGEVVVARDEVRLAVDLDEHADLGVRVDVRLDRALGSDALAAVLDALALLLAEDLDGLLDVAAGLDERLLAVHHPRAGALAQGLHVLGGRGVGVGAHRVPSLVFGSAAEPLSGALVAGEGCSSWPACSVASGLMSALTIFSSASATGAASGLGGWPG